MTIRRLALAAALVAVASLTSAAEPEKLDCARLVPAAVVGKVFPGATVKPFQADPTTAVCHVTVGGNAFAVQAAYLCRPTDTLASFPSVAADKARGKPAVQGLGRAAVGDGSRVLFYDDDADCIVEVNDTTGSKKAIDLAKELVPVLKPAMLPKVAKGGWSLPCDKLVPAALLKKWMPGGKVTPRFVQADQMECKLEGMGMPLIVSYLCTVTYTPDYWQKYKEQAAKQGAKDLTDLSIGKGGVYAMMYGMPSVNLIDGDTGCLITVMAMGLDKPKATALATDLEKAMTPATAR